MKRILLHGFIGIFCIAAVSACNKEVKAPYSKTTTAPKTTSSPAQTTTTTGQQGSSHSCGNHSGNSGSQSGTYNGSGYY